MRFFWSAGAALLVVAVVTGCTSSQPVTGRFTAVIPLPSSSAPSAAATPLPADLPADLSVEIEQERSDYGIRQLQVRVANGGATPYAVTNVTFSSPNFVVPVGNTEPGRVLPALSLDFPVLLPAPVCSGDRSASPIVTLDWSAGAETGRSTVVPADPLGAMKRINGEDCLAESVAGIVDIAPAAHLRVDGSGAASVAHIDLSLTPTGGAGSVVIDGVGPTTLLAPAGGALSWPLALAVDAASAPSSLTLDVEPGRCEPHVIAEDKRGTYLPLTVTVQPAGVSGTYYLPLGDAEKAEVYSWLADHCGFGASP
ncbi:hypothetical protein [Subtercola sp. RTI3]|uniref:hypothetical protein n=1 Tax=Subtercola sp. RTI3 TaxID=3048639 RepID=UPI002B22CE7B|nr:hypothetical protein [Subtercola sp. RTI3]MEA9984504.1 hypothetical protein [Subtercola sp. RTI3]